MYQLSKATFRLDGQITTSSQSSRHQVYYEKSWSTSFEKFRRNEL